MDPITILGAIAAASQLVEQTSKIVNLVIKVYKNIEDAPNAIQNYMITVTNLQNISARIQQNKALQTKGVYEELKSCLALIEKLSEILVKLNGYNLRKPIMMIRYESKIIAILEDIERGKSSLQLCIEENTSGAVDIIGNHTKMIPAMAQHLQTLSLHAEQVSQPHSSAPLVKPYFEVPNRHVRDFVGRREVIDFMIDGLTSGQTPGPRIAVVRAMGGQGKTQVALRACRELRARISAIFWIDATSESLLKRSFDNIAEQIKPNSMKMGSIESRVSYVLKALEEWPESWLLVFDNYDDPSIFNVQDFIPSFGKGSIIITTRHSDVEILATAGLAIELACLSSSEALDLLSKRIKAAGLTFDQTSGEEIVAKLGFHALAIDQASSYISKRRLPMYLFLDQFENQKQFILSETPQMSQYRRRFSDADKEVCLSVFATWELSLQQLQADEGDIKGQIRLLTLMAFCGRGDMTEKMFRHRDFDPKSPYETEDDVFSSSQDAEFQDDNPQNDDSHENFNTASLTKHSFDAQPGCRDSPFSNRSCVITADQLDVKNIEPRCVVCFVRGCFQDPHQRWNCDLFANVLANLFQLSLIQSLRFDDTSGFYRFTIHPLVCDWIKLRITEIEAKSEYAYISSLLLWKLVYGVEFWTRSLFPFCDYFSFNLDAILFEKLEFQEKLNLVTAMQSIAVVYLDGGDAKKGESIIQKALIFTKQACINDNDALVVALRVKLARAVNDQDRITDAKRLCLSLLESIWVDNCTMESISDTLGVLSDVLYLLGESDEIEMLYATYRSSTKVKNWLEMHRYEKLLRTIDYASGLSGLYCYDKMKGLLMEALNESTRMYGDKDPLTGTIFRHLGNIHFERENYSQAEKLLRQAYQIFVIAYGEDDVTTLSTNSALGLTLAKCGRIIDGYQVVSRVLQQQMRFLNPYDSFISDSMVHLAEIETELGMYANAIVHAKRALEGYGARQSIQRPAVLSAVERLAILTPLPIEDKEDSYLRAGFSSANDDELFVAPPLPQRREPEIYKILLQPRLATPHSKPLKVRRTHTHY